MGDEMVTKNYDSNKEEECDPSETVRGLGINGIMKEFIEKPSFSGSYEEELYNVISIYDTL